MPRLSLRAITLFVFEGAALASVAAWGIGRLVSDRWVWSQWLAWIPSLAALAVVAVALAVGWALGRSVRSVRPALLALSTVALLVAMLRDDLGVRAGRPNADGVRLLQWNTNWPAGDDARSAQALARESVDLVLISNRGAITSPDIVRQWAGPQARVVGAGPFALVTTMPVREARQVFAGGTPGSRWWIARFEVLPPAWNGRPLRIAMVDLPSRPSLSRATVAAWLREACEQGSLGEFDVVAGDFNATDGSVILRSCFPGCRDALSEAGTGWLATWPRRFPLWKIDHVLVAPAIEVEEGRTVDPGVGDHRMTRVTLRPR